MPVKILTRMPDAKARHSILQALLGGREALERDVNLQILAEA
jgi:hypothetical protein